MCFEKGLHLVYAVIRGKYNMFFFFCKVKIAISSFSFFLSQKKIGYCFPSLINSDTSDNTQYLLDNRDKP